MSKNIDQIFIANPITTNASTDLMYFGQSPYGAGNDAAMTYSNFAAQFGAPYTAAALTKTDDTNVTLTLGGTPATALLHAASITVGWTGTLSGTRGGTGVNNGASTITIGGSITYSGAFAFTGTLTNTTTVTFPTTGTLATTSQLNFLTWNDVAGTTQAAVINNGYIISNASQTTVTLPATAAEGSVFAVQGKGAAGWILQANTGQVIHLGSSATSSAGSLTSTNLWDSVSIVCVTANTTFACTAVVGNLTVA